MNLRREAAAGCLLVAVSTALAGDLTGLSLDALPAAQWDRAKAAHLLRRAGFGGTPEQVDRFVQIGLAAAVDELVDYQTTPYRVAPPAIDPLVEEQPDRAKLRTMTEEERRDYRQKRELAERKSLEETRLWWLERMVNSPRPFEEKMTLFWHGHFTSGAREVRRAVYLLEQNEFLRRHALDDFGTLVHGISQDRAMLVYLDNVRNVKRDPNENYARELMELFTLGVGHYGEDDVRAAARAFTGWSMDDEGFVLRSAQHDADPKRFLGRTGNLDGDDVVNIILEQPACSEFLARKLLEFYCRPNPDARLVRALAARLRRDKFRLAPVMKALFSSEAFYDPDSIGVLVKSPVELLVGTARQLGEPIRDLPAAERALAGMGQELMQPPNVRGWVGGTHWINTATLFNRYNVVGGLIYGEGAARGAKKSMQPTSQPMKAAMADASGAMMSGPLTPTSRREREEQPPYDPRPAIQKYELQSPEDVVAFYSRYMLAVPLPAEKRTALVQYLQGPQSDFQIEGRQAAERIRTMIHLLCSTPEYQLN